MNAYACTHLLDPDAAPPILCPCCPKASQYTSVPAMPYVIPMPRSNTSTTPTPLREMTP